MKKCGAFLLILLLLAGILSGCKIEFPDDVADIPPLSEGHGTAPGGDISIPSGTTTDTSPFKSETTSTSRESTGAMTTATSGNAATTATQSTSTTKDKYQTDPVPDGKPQPVNPEDIQINQKKTGTCFLSVDCLTILDNKDKLKKEKLAVLPADGIIYKERRVLFYEGESVFDLLNREMKKNRIHMAFRNTPVYNSHYIEGIHNLYELDCGDLSGWIYSVNDWYPNYGCSRYILKEGDIVRWRYTCDLGRDVGCDIIQSEK